MTDFTSIPTLKHDDSDTTFEVLFLGTGASTGVPELGHVLRKTCQLCMNTNNTITSKNRRNNVSIAILFKSKSSQSVNGNNSTKYDQRCIIIDAGKTMRDSVLSHLNRSNINQVDGLILTHGHADACFGLDDVRDLQTFEKVVLSNGDIGVRVVSGPLPIFLHKETMNVVESAFSYLVNPPECYQNVAEGNDILKRRVALLKFNIIDYNENIQIHNMKIRSFPVYHGGEYISLGFAIGEPNSEVVYISDVKIIPDDTFTYLKSLGTIKLLILDMLSYSGIYSHLGLQEALNIVDILKPTKTLFTGMACILGDHDAFNSKLWETHPNVSLAYDGLLVDNFNCDFDIEYVDYTDESMLSDIQRLVAADLSEPYSIFTYRYFLHTWPNLCICVYAKTKSTQNIHERTMIGTIVSKAEFERDDNVLIGYIAMLAINSQFRRRGIGQKLIEMSIERMVRMGCEEITLEAEASNAGALNLYEKFGFLRDEKLTRYYLNGGDAYRLKFWVDTTSNVQKDLDRIDSIFKEENENEVI